MASLLYANDGRGVYADSFYTATAALDPPRSPLTEAIDADIAVIGAGFTGLSAALHLAETGARVVIVEAQRVGWGASGRNGGQLGSGQRQEQPELEALLGRDHARQLWDLSEQAKDLVHTLIARHDIDCDYRPGILHVNHRRRYDDEARRYVEHMNSQYDCDLEYFTPAETAAFLRSPRYSGSVLDMSAGHLHPLKLALGLARATEKAGVQIFEQTEARAIKDGQVIVTQSGQVRAKHIILAGNGYLEGLSQKTARHVMPINNFIIATEPLSRTQRDAILSRDIAVADSKFVVNYFRFAEDRLLFGGRESYGYRFPTDIKAFVRKAMVGIFPQTEDLRIDYGWGGTLAITMNRLPYLRKMDGPIWNASGYSGHGVALAHLCGKLIADAICEKTEGFDAFADIPSPRFPGGPGLRHPLLVLAMLWYSFRDRF